MGLQMGGVDYQSICCIAIRSQFGQDTCKDAHSGPSDPAVVERFVPPIIGRSISLAQSVADDMDNTTDNPSVVRPRDPARLRKKVLDAIKVLLVEPKQMRHGQSSCRP